MDVFLTTLARNEASYSKRRLERTMPLKSSRNQTIVNDYQSATDAKSPRKSTVSPWQPTKRLQPKEYFQKYIREENKKYIQRQRQITIESSSYIEYDRHNKQGFQAKVREYMDMIDREEEMQRASIRAQKEQDMNPLGYNRLNLNLEALEIDNQQKSETLPPLVNALGKATFTIVNQKKSGLNQTMENANLASLSVKKKEIPRYMQANIAWLSKDKHLSNEMTQSIKDPSTHNGKSKGSSLFPALTSHLLKKQKGVEQEGGIYIEENIQIGKNSKDVKKYFVINREDPIIVELFKKICQEKRDSNILRARLTKGKMKAHLSRKYKGKVAEKILQLLDFSVPLDFNQYCEMLERLMNFGQDKLKRIAFNVYNFNNDRYICQLDLYSIMKMYESDDQVFVDAYSYDICKLIAYLDKKRASKGNQNYEFNMKLKAVQKKVEQAMRAHAQSKMRAFYNASAATDQLRETTYNSVSKEEGATHSDLDDSVERTVTASEEEEEEDEDSRSYLDDDFVDEDDDKTTTNITKAGAQSRKSGDFYSRRNSMMSRKGGKDQRKDFKRMNTNMSRMSRTSKISRWSKNSGKSQWSGKSRAGGGSNRRYQGGFFSHYSENQEEEEKENPFDAIFGKDIYKRMKVNKDYIERMNLSEFKQQVEWGVNIFPQFIVDLIAYISGFLIEEHIKQKKAKEREEEENQQLQQVISKRKEAGEKVDENFLLEQLKRQRMTDADADLVQLRNTIGDELYRKLVRFFRNVCKNPVETKDSTLFLTQESLVKKLKNHFGHKCEFLAQRLYYILSGHVNLKRIHLKEFIEKVQVLWEGNVREQNRLAFQIIDIDHDGLLGGPDLLTVQDSIDVYSPYGQEILTLVDHYVSTHLMTKGRVNPKHYLHLDTYMHLLNGQKSCILDELRLKILSKEGKHKEKSVFFRDKAKAEGDMRGRRGHSQVQPNTTAKTVAKRAILMWSGGNHNAKEKKRVTFAYIPACKDEDDDTFGRHRSYTKRIAKDLPTIVLPNVDATVPAGTTTTNEL